MALASGLCLLLSMYSCLFLNLATVVVGDDRQGVAIFAFLEFLGGRLAEEPLLGGGVWGYRKSRYVGVEVVVALVRIFIRRRSEM